MTGESAKAKAIRTINKCEQNLQTWKILSFMENKGRTQQLDRLDIPSSWPDTAERVTATTTLEDPKTATQWKTVTNPKDIEYYLLLRNYQHFGQAHGTPFTIPPLSEEIDWTASTSQATEILTGTYMSDHHQSELCTTLLRQCQARSQLDSIPALISKEEFRGKIKVWNERTTTSPSGRHLGRYKALFAQSKYCMDSEEGATIKQKQEQLEQLILRVLNYCIRTCHPLKRWCQIENTLIFKEMGNYQVHKLRVIHLFEADLNLLYTVKWRQLVHHADNERLIHDGQYGGRPGYEATSLALLEELRIDISYMTRRTMLTFDNDAASCYDRIVVNLASLVNRKYGLHQELTKLHGTILKETAYKVNTAAGVSTSSYKNSTTHPLYGTGQGAGNSPAIWLLISSMLFDTYDIRASGATFVNPDNTLQVKLALTGFVDDTNAVVNDFHLQMDAPLDTSILLLQRDAQLWTDLLYLSGGKLELSKCSYHSLHFRFEPNGTPVAIKDPKCPDLDLIDPATKDHVAVKFLPSTKPHKILGHWKAPVDPKQKTQLKSNNGENPKPFPTYCHKSPLKTWYVLPQCWFTPEQLRAGERKSMHHIISKCGYARTTPIAVLLAPTEYAGAGFLHWHTIQGEGQVKHFLKHWRTDTQVSKMLRIAVGWAQWQAGIGSPILSDVHTPLPYLECRWLSSLRNFLHSINGHIDLDIPYTHESERSGDICIMEFAIASRAFTTQELKYLNYCRMYLHVVTLSDLVNAAGTHVMPHMYECRRPPWFRPETNVVIQRRPSRHQRHYQWKRFCRMLCTESLQLSPNYHLSEWTSHYNQPRLRREAYRDTGSQQSIYVWKDTSYWITQGHPEFPKTMEVVAPTDWTPDQCAEPIDITKWNIPRRFLIQCPRSERRPQSRPATRIPEDFQEYLDTVPQWEQDLLRHTHWILEPFELMQFFETKWTPQEKLLVVSDGSSIPTQTMSFGVVLGTQGGTLLVESMGPAFGVPSSHRAECTGCLTGALILKHLQQYTMKKLPAELEITVLSDNQSMINSLHARNAYAFPYPNATLAPDWDLLEEISSVYNTVWPGKPTMEWIRGHQDEGNEIDSLSIEAQYNIRADHLAGGFTLHQAIHGKYTTKIRRAAAEPALFMYLRKRHGWTQEILDEIDWETFRHSARNMPQTEVSLLKLVHDKLPTNHQKSRYHPWIQDKCNYCSQSETFEHLCLSNCNANSTNFRHELTTSVLTYFQDTQTPPAFRDTFMDAMQMWFSSHSNDEWPQWRGPSALLHRQRDIGWKQMFRGFLSKRWRYFLAKSIKEEQHAHWLDMNLSLYIAAAPEDVSHDDYTVSFENSNQQAKSSPLLSSEPTKYLSKLLRLIWSTMHQLWTNHLNTIHEGMSVASPVKTQELRSQIRALHMLRPKTLAAHRDRYFFSNVEEYIQKASNTQMQRYVNRYQPAILHSIRQAQQTATSAPLDSFPGFSVIHPPARQHPTTQEEPPHRKHTKIRSMITQRITQFFPLRQRPVNPPP